MRTSAARQSKTHGGGLWTRGFLWTDQRLLEVVLFNPPKAVLLPLTGEEGTRGRRGLILRLMEVHTSLWNTRHGLRKRTKTQFTFTTNGTTSLDLTVIEKVQVVYFNPSLQSWCVTESYKYNKVEQKHGTSSPQKKAKATSTRED